VRMRRSQAWSSSFISGKAGESARSSMPNLHGGSHFPGDSGSSQVALKSRNEWADHRRQVIVAEGRQIERSSGWLPSPRVLKRIERYIGA
jgi:hypothetical protein